MNGPQAPRYFNHWDGEERAWRIYDTAIEDDVDGLWGADTEADAAVSSLNDGAPLTEVLAGADRRLPADQEEATET